ncbi:MAG TPA: hypothetical protein VGG39_21130 [Polyangiaceae bacterium]|jgi:hypothetical protein
MPNTQGEFETDASGTAPLSKNSSDENLIDGLNADGSPGDQSAGKHLTLFVPDFTNVAEAAGTSSSANTTPLNSYLRLGAADTRAGVKTHTELGEDLAAMVEGFTDDSRTRTPDATNALNQLPPTGDYRAGESARLHSKGGWRDHSDGNRITTTRGDKVEVIRGNYKLMVLGRQDDPGAGAGFDNSGGQIDTDQGDLESNGGAQQGLNQTWDWDGTRWNVFIQQGSPTPVASPGDPSGANPNITQQTYGNYLFSETTAVQTVSITNAGNNVQTLTGGTLKQSTNVDSISNDVSAGSSISNTTQAATISNATAAFGAQSTVQYSTANFIGNLFGASVEVDVIAAIYLWCQEALLTITQQASATAILNEQAAQVVVSNFVQAPAVNSTITAALQTNTFTGVVVDTHVGLHMDLHPILHADTHTGMHFDMHGPPPGSHVTMDLGEVVKINELGKIEVTNAPTIDLKTAPRISQAMGITSMNTATEIRASIALLWL